MAEKTPNKDQSGTGGTDSHTCLNIGSTTVIPNTKDKDGLKAHTQNNKPSVKAEERLRRKAEENYQQEL